MCGKKQASPAENTASKVAGKGSLGLTLALNSICIFFLQACVILGSQSALFILSVPLWFIFIASHDIMLIL